jgi:hypothetical protein
MTDMTSPVAQKIKRLRADFRNAKASAARARASEISLRHKAYDQEQLARHYARELRSFGEKVKPW